MSLTTKPRMGKSVAQFAAMDRAYTISRLIDILLDEHPGLEGDEKAQLLLDDMQTACWALYQRLGGEQPI